MRHNQGMLVTVVLLSVSTFKTHCSTVPLSIEKNKGKRQGNSTPTARASTSTRTSTTLVRPLVLYCQTSKTNSHHEKHTILRANGAWLLRDTWYELQSTGMQFLDQASVEYSGIVVLNTSSSEREMGMGSDKKRSIEGPRGRLGGGVREGRRTPIVVETENTEASQLPKKNGVGGIGGRGGSGVGVGGIGGSKEKRKRAGKGQMVLDKGRRQGKLQNHLTAILANSSLFSSMFEPLLKWSGSSNEFGPANVDTDSSNCGLVDRNKHQANKKEGGQSIELTMRPFKIVMSATYKFLPNLLNWFIYYTAHCTGDEGLSNIYLICLDQEVETFAATHGIQCANSPSSNSSYSNSTSTSNSNSNSNSNSSLPPLSTTDLRQHRIKSPSAFTSYLFNEPAGVNLPLVWDTRTKLAYMLLQRGYDILMSDTDALWIRNPFLVLQHHLETGGKKHALRFSDFPIFRFSDFPIFRFSDFPIFR